jgi:hypothetical protein
MVRNKGTVGAVETTFQSGALHLAELVGGERTCFAVVRVVSGLGTRVLRTLATRGAATMWLLALIPA